MPTLHRLLYRSQCAIPGAPADVEAAVLRLVEAAKAANETCGLTGALLFADGAFVQAIEGPLAAVEATFERICGDRRHAHVQLIDFTTAEERSFAEWPMAMIGAGGRLISLSARIEDADGIRTDPASAGATIQLMRALLVAGPQEAAATDVRSAEARLA